MINCIISLIQIIYGLEKVFKDYDEIVPEDIDFRQAEYIHIDNLRTWMDDFCNEVINLLESRR